MFVEVGHEDGLATNWINSDHIVSVRYRSDYNQYNVTLINDTETQISGDKAMASLEAALKTSHHPRSSRSRA